MEALLQIAAGVGGIGGVMAVLIFLVKRQDDRDHTDELNRIHQKHAEELDQIRKEHAADITRITTERQQFYHQFLTKQYEIAEKLAEALNGVRNGLDKNNAAIAGLADLSQMAEQLRKLTDERRT